MGAVVFDNYVFDSWLTKKSEDILSKVDRETISTEEMIVLILKSQTNHYHHVEVEFREEFKAVRTEMASGFKDVHSEFKFIRSEIDSKFEKVWRFQMWSGGAILALFGGLYLKLFLG